MDMLGWILGVVVVFAVLGYFRAPTIGWTLAAGLLAACLSAIAGFGFAANVVLFGAFPAVALALNVPALRRALITNPILAVYRRILPDMSQTEKEAIDAGTVWWDGDLFSGRPDFDKLLAVPEPRLSAEEQAFLDGPVEELCAMCNDWEITHELQDLPAHVWQFIKERGFLGMIIPKKYGGLGFSALAHSAVVMKLATPPPHPARPRRAAPALRHRRAEGSLPAAPREGIGDPLLRPHQPGGRLGRGVDSGLWRGVQ